MTKIIIVIPEFGGVDHALYRTKEEWDASEYSHAALERRIEENRKRVISQGHFGGGGGPHIRASSEPTKYPCIAICGSERYVSNGPDEMTYVFIYDFEIQED